MQSLRFKTLLQSASLFFLSALLVPLQAVATEPADEKAAITGEVEATATETGPDTWDKTKEVSGEAWGATKEGSAKAWDKTRELTRPDKEETVEPPQPDPQGTQL